MPRSSLLLLSVLLTTPAMAQGPSSQGSLAITLTARPDRALPGSRIVLSGHTGFTGAGSKVLLAITPPGGKPPVPISASLTPAGEFRAEFTTALALGTWQVRATAPDGKGTAQASFAIVAPGVLPTEVAAQAEALGSAVTQVAQRVRTGLGALPPSPARTEALGRLPELETRVKQLGPQAATLRKELTTLFQARAAVTTPVPAWDEYQGDLGSWTGEAARRRTELLKASPAAQSAGQQCAQIDAVIEDLASISEAMAAFKTPFDATIALGYDKLPGSGLARGTQLSEAQQFALTQSAKAAAAVLQGPAGVVEAGIGFAVDLGGYLAKQTFAAYCERFEGPFKATFLGESFTTKGEPFLDYTVRLDGRLLLMYPKNVSGTVIPLQGYLEGTGQFSVRDNPAPVIRLTPGTVLFHRVQSPPGSPYVPDVSRPTQRLLPHSFRIPVTGTLQGDSIVFKLGPADHDFSDLIRGVSTYVVMPTGGLVPQIINSDIAIQKAHPIVERTVRWHPVLKVVTRGKDLVAERSYARDTTNAGRTARVRTQLTIKVCNPGCLIGPTAAKP